MPATTNWKWSKPRHRFELQLNGAAYYPAPPFKTTGVGRFYVTPTDNDPAALKANNRSALATSPRTKAPGPRLYYKVLTVSRSDRP